MKKGRAYKIKINITTSSSNVCLAECSCSAGRGPHGSCKHFAATLLALENFNTIREEIQFDDTYHVHQNCKHGISLGKDA